jgi:hypothetical protein
VHPQAQLHPFHFPAMHPLTNLSLTILMSFKLCKETLEQFMRMVCAFLNEKADVVPLQ